MGTLAPCAALNRLDLVARAPTVGEAGPPLLVGDRLDALLVTPEAAKEDLGLDDMELLGLCPLGMEDDGDGECETEEWNE